MNDKLSAAEERVVRFHYAVHDDSGAQVESSREGEPAAALLGQGNLMPGIEKALLGHAAGDRYQVTLTPDQAFGQRRDNFTQRISKKYVARADRLKPGMHTQVQTSSGVRTVTVVKVGGKFLDVDLNHPLAGQTVTCDLEIIEVREATPEELAHGHAHGPGGHHG